MYLCAKGIDVASFSDFSIEFRNCSENVVFSIFILLHIFVLF